MGDVIKIKVIVEDGPNSRYSVIGVDRAYLIGEGIDLDLDRFTPPSEQLPVKLTINVKER